MKICLQILDIIYIYNIIYIIQYYIVIMKISFLEYENMFFIYIHINCIKSYIMYLGIDQKLGHIKRIIESIPYIPNVCLS